MQALPHQYQVKAAGRSDGNLEVSVTNIPDLAVAPPSQFGGPGDQWSPEDLFMSSIASCFILSFRAISRASKLNWLSIECHSKGVLERIDGKTRFTKVLTKAYLIIPPTESIENAERLLHKADQSCLISNSLTTEMKLECVVNIEE